MELKVLLLTGSSSGNFQSKCFSGMYLTQRATSQVPRPQPMAVNCIAKVMGVASKMNAVQLYDVMKYCMLSSAKNTMMNHQFENGRVKMLSSLLSS